MTVGVCPPAQWFMKEAVLPRLLALLDDPDATVRTKAVLAISAIVRHNAPGLQQLLEQGGLPRLAGLLSHPEPRLQRKVTPFLSEDWC
jgi:HEAT repeat protein